MAENVTAEYRQNCYDGDTVDSKTGCSKWNLSSNLGTVKGCCDRILKPLFMDEKTNL